MTFQLIKKDGKLRGIAIMLGNGMVLSGSVEHRELWRICDLCQKNEAIVFCRTHARYHCGTCWESAFPHLYPGYPGLDAPCNFISMAVARELALSSMIRAEVGAD